MENRFVFLGCSYNMSETLPQMLHSICGQSYDNWKVIITDDISDENHLQSTKDTFQCFQRMLNGRYSEQLQLIINSEKAYETKNVLNMINLCDDHDIICRIDADDWLIDNDALTLINSAYNQSKCETLWTKHRWGFSDKNISGPLPQHADPYRYPWVSSHLKTFRKYLLNDVKDENYRNENGEYIRRAGDQAIYLPALYHSKINVFLDRTMYHYSIKDVPETYQTNDAKMQKNEAEFIRRRGYVK